MRAILQNAALPALLFAALAAPAGAENVFDVVAGGEVRLAGGEQICFRFDREDLAEVQVRVRLRFTSWVPRGHVELDGIPSAAFREPAEEFSFWVDPRGIHRLSLVLEESATVDRLLLVTTRVRSEQTSCREYETRRSRRVDPVVPEPLNRLGDPPPPPPPPAATPLPPAPPAPRAEAGSADRSGRLPLGTELDLRLERELSTRTAYAGQAFTARLATAVHAGGRTVLPEGTRVRGRVLESKDAGRFGRSKLTLAFDQALLPDGTAVDLIASLQRLGSGSAKKQGGIIAGSAIGGALLGQLLGGDSESSMLGAAIGGAVAAGSIAAKPGEPVILPAGTALTVGLDAPLDVPTAR